MQYSTWLSSHQVQRRKAKNDILDLKRSRNNKSVLSAMTVSAQTAEAKKVKESAKFLRSLPSDMFYSLILQNELKSLKSGATLKPSRVEAFDRAAAEARWFADKRPYFRLSDTIISGVVSSPVSVKASAVSSPLLTIAINLPCCNFPTLSDDSLDLQSMLVECAAVGSTHSVADVKESESSKFRRFFVHLQYKNKTDGSMVYESHILPITDETGFFKDNVSVFAASSNVPSRVVAALNLIPVVCVPFLKLCHGILNSGYIVPDVLSSDRAKYASCDNLSRIKLVDKARRRGKYGWTIGDGVEFGDFVSVLQ